MVRSNSVLNKMRSEKLAVWFRVKTAWDFHGLITASENIMSSWYHGITWLLVSLLLSITVTLKGMKTVEQILFKTETWNHFLNGRMCKKSERKGGAHVAFSPQYVDQQM